MDDVPHSLCCISIELLHKVSFVRKGQLQPSHGNN